MKIEKIYPETLLQLMLDVLERSSNFSYIEGIQPFLMSFANREYYVYVKNLSSAYFPERPDTTRVQLPIRDEFEEIKKSINPFIFLGYDQNNDVLVCWNFHVVKMRLNEKKSVSFYSRQFFQDEVLLGSFLHKYLKNEDELILFKRKNLLDFFAQIDSFFSIDGNESNTSAFFSSSQESQEVKFGENNYCISGDKLLKITDNILIEQLKPLIESNHTLQAMKVAADYYKEQFPSMKLKDWSVLIKNIDYRDSVAELIECNEYVESLYKTSIDDIKNEFVNYMQERNLSETTISHYVKELSGRISDGIRNYLNPDLEDIFKITDISLLNLWLSKLFTFHEYMMLNKIGKNMYSCALKKYIQFIEFLYSKKVCIVAEPQVPYIVDSNQENYAYTKKRKKYILKVTYPDGRIVAEREVYKTLIDVIKNAGFSNVQSLGIFVNKVNLVSETTLPRYEIAQKSVGNGLYVMTNSSTDAKQQIIEQISEAFGMNLKIEKIPI